MRLETHIKGFERTEALDNFLRDAVDGLANDLLKNERDVHIIVSGDEDRHRTQNRKPHFYCEVQVKTASSKKWNKTLKSAEDFHTAVIDAFHAMKGILQKRSDRRHTMKLAAVPISAFQTVENNTSEEVDDFEPAENVASHSSAL